MPLTSELLIWAKDDTSCGEWFLINILISYHILLLKIDNRASGK